MTPLEFWQGEFGNEYTERNANANIDARVALWREIMACIDPQPESILEIGAGGGKNLVALRRLGYWDLKAVEPNATARRMLRVAGFRAYDGTAANMSMGHADLVFTSGVLIHIPPDELLAACQGIYDVAEHLIVCIEYFSHEPEEKLYRGHAGRLWKRDFGSYWLDNFNLEHLGNGFSWKRTTGLDNLHWWAFRKCN